ncbi:MAG: hypothetical protein Q7T19_09660 [Caulobacter sp.]|nr:hypothetical protein [Caulobacter sp.]
MTDVTTTPPALRWVALFLAACAVLGLFLGFRDQIRKNPPGWYTGAEQVATPLPQTGDSAREAVAFEPSAASPAPAAAPVEKAAEAKTTTPAETATETITTPASKIAPPVPTPAPAPKLKAAAPAPRASPSADPVGDILEGQKRTEDPDAAPVPY